MINSSPPFFRLNSSTQCASIAIVPPEQNHFLARLLQNKLLRYIELTSNELENFTRTNRNAKFHRHTATTQSANRQTIR